MLSAIKDIGQITSAKPREELDYKEAKILSINIDIDNSSNKFVYKGIELEDFQSAKIGSYPFKKRASKGNSPAPFSPLIKPDKTLKKIIVWIKQCQIAIDKGHIRTDSNDTKIITGTYEVLEAKRKSIIEDIDKKISNLPKKTIQFLALKLCGRYPGEYEIFQSCLDYFGKEKRKKSLNTGVCSICAEPHKEVSGKTDVFKFYTIDKPGFITGGFKLENAWKNYPVCEDCSKYLESGRDYLEKNLNFRFYGFSYLLIPRLLLHENDELEKILNLLVNTKKEISLKRKTVKRITDDHQEILEALTEQGDMMTMNFLFLQRQQSAERILLLIEDVFPSRIKKIFEAKAKVDKIFNDGRDRTFTFGTIRTFFSKSDKNKKTNDLDKYFLNIVKNVFTGTRLDKSFLIKFFMPVIRVDLLKEDYPISGPKEALMILMFLEFLGIISFEEDKGMGNGKFQSFFDRFGQSFARPATRGIFLTGVLTQRLLRIQSDKRNTKPFLKKLKGLRMNKADIRAILPQAQNKLEEYGSFNKEERLIASHASKYLLEAGDDWKVSVDEINFYFACGLNLADEIEDISITDESNKEG